MRRVLVVEDYQDTANMLSLVLEQCGYQTRLAPDGPSALMVAKFWAPHVVLLDLGLPGLDGYEVAHRLRNEIGLKDARIIVLSGYKPDELRQNSSGIDCHQMKPVDIDKLLGLIGANQA
jgi:CheY-like chemotaxis protein